MTAVREMMLGPYRLSHAKPPVFLAEIGGFFGQDIKLASAMIEEIIGVARQVSHQPVILKTEILHDAEICLPGNTLEIYASKDGRVQKENYRALIERKIVSLDQYGSLLSICRDAKMPFLVSVYDFAGADFAIQAGTCALKIASPNVVHLPLIRHCAGKRVPLILDTGRSTIGEVYRAVETARLAGCDDIVIEHSPDGHPALPKAHNLRILESYLQAFGLPVGISDHHVGLEMLYMSVALGATVIEKGVHVAPDDLDIDISHTMDIRDLAQTLRSLHDCWLALGHPSRDKRIAIEGVIGTSQRQCLVAKTDVRPGDLISLETVRFAFPCRGIPVEHWDLVAGWQVVRPVRAGQPMRWSDVQQRSD